MGNFKFGERSLKNLSTCHEDIQTVMKESIRTSKVDFGISHGHRPKEKQFEIFKKGRELDNGVWKVVNKKEVRTNVDGYKKVGKHNYSPAEACDIYVFIPGRKDLAYDKVHMAYLGGHINATADRLYQEGKIRHQIRWGGNWDGDGILLFDQRLWDMPHYEII